MFHRNTLNALLGRLYPTPIFHSHCSCLWKGRDWPKDSSLGCEFAGWVSECPPKRRGHPATQQCTRHGGAFSPLTQPFFQRDSVLTMDFKFLHGVLFKRGQLLK